MAVGPTTHGQARRTSFNELGWFGKKACRLRLDSVGADNRCHLGALRSWGGPSHDLQYCALPDVPALTHLVRCPPLWFATLMTCLSSRICPSGAHKTIDCEPTTKWSPGMPGGKPAHLLAALQVRNEMVQRVVEAQPGRSYTVDEVACCSVSHGEKFRPIMRFQCARSPPVIVHRHRPGLHRGRPPRRQAMQHVRGSVGSNPGCCCW